MDLHESYMFFFYFEYLVKFEDYVFQNDQFKFFRFYNIYNDGVLSDIKKILPENPNVNYISALDNGVDLALEPLFENCVSGVTFGESE